MVNVKGVPEGTLALEPLTVDLPGAVSRAYTSVSTRGAKARPPWFFFVVAELETSEPKTYATLASLTGFAARAYGDRALKNPGIPPDRMVTEVLNLLNARWRSIAKETVNYPIAAGSLAFGVVTPTAICLATRGEVRALLYRTRMGVIKSTNILSDEGQSAENKTYEGPLFSSVVTGTLHGGERILIAGPTLFNVCAPDDLRKICGAQGRTEDGVGRLKGMLPRTLPDPLAALLIALPARAWSGPSRHASQASMHTLWERARATEKTLEPPVGPNIRPFLELTKKGCVHALRALSVLGGIVQKNISRALPTFARALSCARTKLHVPFPQLSPVFAFLRSRLTPSTHRLRSLHVTLIRIMRPVVRALTRLYKESMGTVRFALRALVAFLARLPPSRRLAWSGAVCALIVLVVSITASGVRARDREARAAYETTIRTIEEKRNTAEARLLFGDEKEATALLREANALIAALKTQDEAQKSKERLLKDSIELVAIKLRKETRVAFMPISSVDSVREGMRAEHMLSMMSGVIVWQSEPPAVVYAQGSTVERIGVPAPIQTLAHGVRADDAIVFLGETGARLSFNDKKFSMFDFERARGEGVPVAGAMYFGKLYTTDGARIFKHEKSTSGFARGAPWLKDGTVLRGATAVAIDGSVWIATGETVEQFERGERTSFSLTAVEPPPQRIVRILTDVKSNYLYLVTRERMIVLTKKGMLVRQFIFPREVNDVAIDEKKKKAYVVYDATLAHFPLTGL